MTYPEWLYKKAYGDGPKEEIPLHIAQLRMLREMQQEVDREWRSINAPFSTPVDMKWFEHPRDRTVRGIWCIGVHPPFEIELKRIDIIYSKEKTRQRIAEALVESILPTIQ